MRVYFDARMIDHPGIGRYIRCLLPLIAKDGSVDLYLLGNRERIKKFLPLQAKIIDFDYPIYSLQEQIGFLRLKKMISKCQSVKVSKCQREDYILHIPHYNVPVLARFNFVATIHDIMHITYPQGASGRLAPAYMKFMVQKILKTARAVICVSQATRDEIEKRFFANAWIPAFAGTTHHGNDKLHVIYEGADEVFTKMTDSAYLKEIKQKYGLPDRFILYVGSIRRHKNISALLDAFGQFRKRMPDVSLVMVGRRSQDIDIRRDGVVYLGEIESDKELAAVYNLASCLLNLSLYEGFGLTILEAQRCGLPVVCSDIAVHKEVGGPEAINAVKASYIDQICDNLYNILSNKNLREFAVLKGLKNADRFNWRKTAEDTINLYRKMCNESSDSPRLAAGNARRGEDTQCLL